MSQGPAARIDRTALERVIHRAAELQSAEHDIGDTLTSDELMALGREVGIPVRYLQQALLEERTRIATPAPAGSLDRLAGPGQAVAHRVIAADSETVERTLLRWMETNELLCVQRALPGRITWEPVGGLYAAFRRSTAVLGPPSKPFILSRATTVSAIILPLEAGYSHVTLNADARAARNGYVGGSAALAGSGAAGSGRTGPRSPTGSGRLGSSNGSARGAADFASWSSRPARPWSGRCCFVSASSTRKR